MSGEQQFKQLIDRVLRCREAEDEAKADTKEVYAELKALGYDKTAAGALVAEIRKKDKNPDQFEERNAVLDLYRDAYERASHAHTREANEIHERPSLNAEAYPEAGPQAEASPVGTGAGVLAGHEGRSEGEAVSADLPTHSQSAPVADAVAGSPETPKPPEPVTAEITDPQEPSSSRADADKGEDGTSSLRSSPAYSPSTIIPAPTDEEMEIPAFLRRSDGYAKHGEASA